MITIKRTDNGDETVVELSGTLDVTTAPEMRSISAALVAEGRRLVTLEMSHLALIDSSGVGVIVALFKGVRAKGGNVQIVGLRDQPRAIFRLLRLDRVFPI